MGDKLREAARKLLLEIDAEVNNRDGENWLVSTGCYECTEGCVPDHLNTGLCGYHGLRAAIAVEELLIARDGPAPVSKSVEGGAVAWRCFHCDEVFTDRDAAAIHFGLQIAHNAMCVVDPREFRAMERELERYRDEDSDKDREMARLRIEHQAESRRQEEAGYARGLKDANPATSATARGSQAGAGEGEGLTPKEAWWAGARVGLGLAADTPRTEVSAALAAAGKGEA